MAVEVAGAAETLSARISAGNDVIGAVPGVYGAALAEYGDLKDAKEFHGRFRSLELMLANATQYTLEFDDEYFNSGTWFWSPKPLVIMAGKISMMYVANRAGSILTGVTGGLRYKIVGTDKYLLMGFNNPAIGSYKNFITVTSKKHHPQWAYDNSLDDTVKHGNCEGFRVTVTMQPSRKSPFRMFQYVIKGVEEKPGHPHEEILVTPPGATVPDLSGHLTMEHLKIIHPLLLAVQPKWFNLGLQLGIQAEDLHRIEFKYKNEPDRFLPEIMVVWLARPEPKATLATLVAALKNPTVGEEGVAMDIEEKYLKL